MVNKDEFFRLYFGSHWFRDGRVSLAVDATQPNPRNDPRHALLPVPSLHEQIIRCLVCTCTGEVFRFRVRSLL